MPPSKGRKQLNPRENAKCIPLKGSTTCPAFENATISTNSTLVGYYPFLQYVDNVKDFDDELNDYIKHDYVTSKYRNILGCDDLNLDNTSALYARYTTSVLCNSIVQNSKDPCNVSSTDAPPLCADSCAQHAQSEELITINSTLCSHPKKTFMSEIRADFTTCALPVNALSGDCVSADRNEPDNCGFASNLPGLCGYCAKSSPNATDSCCPASNVEKRCRGVHLPVPSAPPLFPSSTSSATPSATPVSHRLSHGAIAGAVVGSVAGAVLLFVLPCLLLCLRRRRNQAEQASAAEIFNRPTPSVVRSKCPTFGESVGMVETSRPAAGRQGSFVKVTSGGERRGIVTADGFEALMTPPPGGREMRMSAIQDPESEYRDRGRLRGSEDPSAGGLLIRKSKSGELNNGEAGEQDGRENGHDDANGYSTPAQRARGTPPVVGKRRQNSQSSTSILNDAGQPDANINTASTPHATAGTTTVSAIDSSPSSDNTNPSNDHNATANPNVNAIHPSPSSSTGSEQLSSFKDYYSHAPIRPGDRVAVLWAYTPRADDEFALQRGQMLRVVGIWDDGWATGVRVRESVEEWEVAQAAAKRARGGDKEEEEGGDEGDEEVKEKAGRRSSVGGDVKAFPLVCVCLPQYWRKAVEAEINL